MRGMIASILMVLVSTGIARSQPAPTPALPLPERLAEQEAKRIAAIAKAIPSTAAIFDSKGEGGGSGVIVTPDGLVLTNFHVVASMGMAMKVGLSDGKLYDAVLVGIDPVGDVAMIKLLGREDFPAATLGDSDRVRVGETVFAAGNPFLLAHDYQPTITLGVVSGVGRYQPPAGTLIEYTDCIQTDAAINPGNSGGPLFNLRAEVIGINGRGSFGKRSRVSVGIGYAISINQVKNFYDHLHGGLLVDHASLGATVTTNSEGRVIVQEVMRSSSAFRLGLRAGDEVVSFGGRPIGTVNQFKNVLGIYPKGWPVELSYRRDEFRTTITPRLAGVHRDGELAELVRGEKQSGPPGKEPSPDKPKPEDTPPGKPNDPKSPHGPHGDHGEKMPAAAPAIPAIAKPLIEERPGYANFFFNRIQQEALLASLAKSQDFSAKTGTWKLAFAEKDGAPIDLRLGEEAVAWNQGDDLVALRLGIDPPLDSPEITAALRGLDHWRRLLIDRTQWFSKVTFVGGFPDPKRGHQKGEPLVLGLAMERAGSPLLWFFDRTTRELRGLHVEGDDLLPDVDLLFTDYRPLEGGSESPLFPHRIEILSPGSSPRVLTLEKGELGP